MRAIVGKIALIALAVLANAHKAVAQAQVIRLSQLVDEQRVAITLTTKPLPRDNCTSTIDPKARPLVSYIDQQKMQAIIDSEKATSADKYVLYSVSTFGGKVASHRIETTMPEDQAARIDARINDAIKMDDAPAVTFRLRLDPASADEPLRLGRAMMCPPVLVDQSKTERAISDLGRRFRQYSRAVVIVWFLVDVNGLAVQTQIRDSSTDPKFDAAAADIVKKNIHFKPALFDGVPAQVWVQIPIVLQVK